MHLPVMLIVFIVIVTTNLLASLITLLFLIFMHAKLSWLLEYLSIVHIFLRARMGDIDSLQFRMLNLGRWAGEWVGEWAGGWVGR